MSPQPSGSPDSGKPGSPLRNRTPSARLADFRARLDTRQVEGELDAIFRESPEFGRNLAHRLSPFLETHERLSWTKNSFLATDVRPENALVAEATGMIHPIDFIVAGREIAP